MITLRFHGGNDFLSPIPHWDPNQTGCWTHSLIPYLDIFQNYKGILPLSWNTKTCNQILWVLMAFFPSTSAHIFCSIVSLIHSHLQLLWGFQTFDIFVVSYPNRSHFSTFIIWINRVVLTKMEVLQDQSESVSLHCILNQAMLYIWCLFPIHPIWRELYITTEHKDSQKVPKFSSASGIQPTTLPSGVLIWHFYNMINQFIIKKSSKDPRCVQSWLLLSNLSISKFLGTLNFFTFSLKACCFSFSPCEYFQSFKEGLTDADVESVSGVLSSISTRGWSRKIIWAAVAAQIYL